MPGSETGHQDVGDAVFRGEIVLRFVEFDPFPDDAGKALVLAVGQEYRFRLGGIQASKCSAVQLLFPAGQSCFLMTPLVYSSTEAQPTDARLHAAPHDLAVNVEGRFFIPDEVALADECFQVFPRPGIGFRGVDGGFARVDVGAADVEEGGVVSGGHFPGLPVVHDVIGEGGNPRGQFPGRTEGGEGMECGHGKMREYRRLMTEGAMI